MEIKVLRLGHRIHRDQRITTHCCLVARAFGASEITYSGQKDKGLENSIHKITKNFGGPFSIHYAKNWKPYLEKYKGKTVHLTVYGLPVQDKIPIIRKENELLIIVGGEKVPPEIYQKADWNISVTSQPHSEIAALSIFMHEYFKGKELAKKFPGKKRIIPQIRGKRVITS